MEECICTVECSTNTDSVVNGKRKEPGFLMLLFYYSFPVDKWAMPGSFLSFLLED